MPSVSRVNVLYRRLNPFTLRVRTTTTSPSDRPLSHGRHSFHGPIRTSTTTKHEDEVMYFGSGRGSPTRAGGQGQTENVRIEKTQNGRREPESWERKRDDSL